MTLFPCIFALKSGLNEVVFREENYPLPTTYLQHQTFTSTGSELMKVNQFASIFFTEGYHVLYVYHLIGTMNDIIKWI